MAWPKTRRQVMPVWAERKVTDLYHVLSSLFLPFKIRTWVATAVVGDFAQKSTAYMQRSLFFVAEGTGHDASRERGISVDARSLGWSCREK